MIRRETAQWTAIFIAVVILAGAWSYWRFNPNPEVPPPPPPVTFEGASSELVETVITPTLEENIELNKSKLWIAAFSYAWNRLRDDLAKEAVELPGAQEWADRLNRNQNILDDIERFHVYAVAGLGRDAIVPRIQMQMANQFPQVPRPEITVPLNGMVLYAYLNMAMPFPHAYLANDKPFNFTDSAGKTTPVKSFGLPEKVQNGEPLARSQVRVLYRSAEAAEKGTVPEFVLDLCEGSKPYQLLVAKVPRGATLAETIADVEAKIAAAGQTEGKLSAGDVVLVPSLAFRIGHRFTELEGPDKQFANRRLKGTFLAHAFQAVHFRLERGGAEPASEGRIQVAKNGPPEEDKQPPSTRYELDQPFLILLKKRGGERPFFVLWVDNAELLEKW